MKEGIPFQPPLLVTYDEAAALLSVSPRTVQRMVARGEIPLVRITRDTPRIRYADVAVLVRERSGETLAD